jgi:hypothetical protein
MLEEIRDLVDTPGAPSSPEPVLWCPARACQLDDDYKTCVMWQFVVRSEWTPRFVHALNVALKREFGLVHDIRWVGLVRSHGLATAPLPRWYDATHSMYKAPRHHAAFVVHVDDMAKISNLHRMALGFCWFFDVVGQGFGEEHHFPYEFVEQYAGFNPWDSEISLGKFMMFESTFPQGEVDRDTLEAGGVVRGSKRDTCGRGRRDAAQCRRPTVNGGVGTPVSHELVCRCSGLPTIELGYRRAVRQGLNAL